MRMDSQMYCSFEVNIGSDNCLVPIVQQIISWIDDDLRFVTSYSFTSSQLVNW